MPCRRARLCDKTNFTPGVFCVKSMSMSDGRGIRVARGVGARLGTGLLALLVGACSSDDNPGPGFGMGGAGGGEPAGNGTSNGGGLAQDTAIGNGGSAQDTTASGRSSGDTGDETQRGRTLWTITNALPSLVGLDTASHEVVFDVSVAEGSIGVTAIDIGDDQVWLGRDDGTVVIVDRGAEQVAAEVDLTPFAEFPEEPLQASHVLIGSGAGYSVAAQNIEPPVLRIDASTFEVTATADILPLGGYLNGMAYDGSDLWLVSWNSLALVRADPGSLELRGTVPLGQNPDDLSGFGDFYGYGYLARTDAALWILDTISSRLVGVDPATLTPRAAGDLSDLTDFQTYLEFAANQSSVFLLLENEASIVRFDGTTGERVQTYDLSTEGGVSGMAVASDRLYVSKSQSPLYEILELDIESGEVLQVIESPYAIDRIAVQP